MIENLKHDFWVNLCSEWIEECNLFRSIPSTNAVKSSSVKKHKMLIFIKMISTNWLKTQDFKRKSFCKFKKLVGYHHLLLNIYNTNKQMQNIMSKIHFMIKKSENLAQKFDNESDKNWNISKTAKMHILR